MTERSTPGGRVPGHRRSLLDLVLGAAFVALWAFIALADKPPALDVRALDALPPRSGAGSVPVLSWVTRLVADVGEPTTWTVVTLMLSAVLAVALGSWVPLRLVAVPVLIEAALVLALKALVHRSGPAGEAHPRTFGYFPSGHTATALVCTGAVAALVAVWRPGWRRWLRIAVLGWALLMGVALVYYRYHWVSDVIGSLLLGLLILRVLCRPLWAPGDERAASAGSGDDPSAQDDPLRLSEDA